MSEQPRRILLAEDDRILRKVGETTLRRHGFEVVVAVDGEEALQMARSRCPSLILLDMIMPKLNGFEVLRTLKQDPATSGIPVIVLSNLGQDTDVQQTLAAGALAYLIKVNMSPRDLIHHVEAALAAGKP